MTDNTAGSQLKDLSLNAVSAVNTDYDFPVVIKGKKISNAFARSFVEVFKEGGKNDAMILQLMLSMDEKVEAGILSEEDLLNNFDK